ncbi:cyclin-like protein [Bipolaris maydis]|uniref:cyclin-like protein n=1 Tax=Cochliobolus heterostrophus TaxID=5016 RepID=UPI0024DA8A86|nr:cyclin-like protein [Bipolaris maydis]KAJ6265112.1 cyclin-like protein [Bipolaris maydis]
MNFGDSDDIFKYFRSIERLLKPDPLYMDKQSKITWKYRFIVIDWIMGVHQNFKFSPETLFLAVNLLDRFLASREIRIENLQLAGITAFLIASKYEESLNERILDECLDMTENAYTRENFMEAEKSMLKTLDYNLGWPGPLSFLRRINKADDYDDEIRNMAKYFLEVATLDKQFADCIPSFLSAGAYYLARDILKKGGWSQLHIYYSEYTASQLQSLANAICDSCYKLGKRKVTPNVLIKYADKSLLRVSETVKEELKRLRELKLRSEETVGERG